MSTTTEKPAWTAEGYDERPVQAHAKHHAAALPATEPEG